MENLGATLIFIRMTKKNSKKTEPSGINICTCTSSVGIRFFCFFRGHVDANNDRSCIINIIKIKMSCMPYCCMTKSVIKKRD